MSLVEPTATQSEAVGVFDDAQKLQDAIDELLGSGFDHAELSLLADEHSVEQKLGHVYQKTSDLGDDPNAPRTAYVSTGSIGDVEGGLIGGLMYFGAIGTAGFVAASGGALIVVVAAAALMGTAGGLIGTALAKLVGDRRAEYFDDHLRHGGLLLWVRTRDDLRELRAIAIMRRHSGHDVHLHGLEDIDG
jgi:hypothetical protein